MRVHFAKTRFLWTAWISLTRLVLGTVPAQHARLVGTLMTLIVYLACELALWSGVALGLTARHRAIVFSLILMINPTLFYVAIRGRLDTYLSDKEMTLLQMIFAIVVTCIAYAILTPAFRFLTLLLVPLIMAFGMIGRFSLTPRQSRGLAIFTLAIYGCTMTLLESRWPTIFDPKQEFISFLTLIAAVPTMATVSSQVERLQIRLRNQRNALQVTLAELEVLTSRDVLTGVFNRRFMVDHLITHYERLQSKSFSTCLGMVDLDHFKQINDQNGHLAGDETLRRFGKQVRQCLREADVVARWGGEEFLLLLPKTNLKTAIQVLERLRMSIADEVLWQDRPELKVTISIGVVSWKNGETVEQVVARADRLAYLAKNSGRDRVVGESTTVLARI